MNISYSRGFSTFNIGLVIIGFIVVSMIASTVIFYTTQEWTTATVWEKDRECSSSVDSDGATTTSCFYVVHTDTESFQNRDSLLALKFNSSDVQRQLRPNETYELLVVGYRVPFLSMYRNIIDFRQAQVVDSTEETILW